MILDPPLQNSSGYAVSTLLERATELGLSNLLDEIQFAVIRLAVKEAEGAMQLAANRLQMKRTTLINLRKRYRMGIRPTGATLAYCDQCGLKFIRTRMLETEIGLFCSKRCYLQRGHQLSNPSRTPNLKGTL